jgi:hypothetical protein
MSATEPQLAAPPADLLTQAIELVRPQLERSRPLKERVEIYWSAVAAASSLAAVDIAREEFLRLATETGLAGDLRQHADLYNSDKTLEHVLRWGLLRRNPFR